MEDKKTEEVVITDNVSPGTVDTASASERYSRASRFFHWAITALVLFLFLKFGDRIAESLHSPLAIMMAGMIAGHVFMAIYNHWIKKIIP